MIKAVHTRTSTCLRVLRVRVMQHDQSGTNVIKVAHPWTSTHLRVRAAQHDQSSANGIKVAHTQTSTHLKVHRVRVAQTGQAPALMSLGLGEGLGLGRLCMAFP